MQDIIPYEKRIRDKRYKKIIEEKIILGEKVDIYDFAQYMRFNPTLGEYILYHEFLFKRQEKFRKQHIIKPFIVDFYCPGLKLVIEADGSSHDDKYEYDIRREAFLIEKGYNIARITEKDILRNLDSVAQFLADVFKYIFLLKKYNIKPGVGERYLASPLSFGKKEILDLFTEEERKPVEDVFEKWY